MRLSDLLDIDMLRRLSEANYAASGMPIGIIDAVDGSVLVGFGWQDICTMYHRVNALTVERCRESDDYIKAHLSPHTPCEYTCQNGLRDIGVPIIAGAEHLATLFLGQFFYEGEAPNRGFFIGQARRFGFDEAAYLAALDRVPVFSRASVESILKYNIALAGFISDLADASLRRREAEQRAESLARFPEENPDPVLRLARDSTVIYANEEARSGLAALGVEVGSPAPPPLLELAQRAADEGQRVQAEMLAGDRAFLMSSVAVSEHVNIYGHDITDRKRAEQALARERALLASVMHATDVMLVYLDPDFNFVWVNEAYAATCNMKPGEMAGKNHFALYPHAENEAIFRRVRDTGEPVFYKDRPFAFPDQPERGVTYWDWSLVPVKDGSGTVQGLVLSLRETTKYKTAEMELRESETRFRALFENLLDGYAYCQMLYDEQQRPVDFVYLAVNAAFGRLTGLENVVGRKVNEVIPGVRESEPGLFETYGRVASTGQPERFEIHFKPLGKWFAISVYSPKKGHFVAAFDDITSRKRIEQQLRDANRAKDDFIGMLSHELRNPLAPIRNSLYILDHAEPTGQAACRAKEVAGRQLTHLTRLVDDLLDVTRIVRGKVELRRTDIDIANLARLTCEDHRALMRERGLQLDIEAPDKPVWVDGDETRLAQVIGNLLQNAAKFTPVGGQVAVSVVPLPDAVEVRVRDTGSGIDAELLADIFNPFVQAKQSLARTEGGLGLGLALAKGLVELHGGAVTASSAGRNQGAVFIVRLPMMPTADATSEVPAQHEPRATNPLRVVVVDDNKDAADSLAEVVRTLGHQAEVALDGWSAVEMVRGNPPDIVLCDIGLPGMSGYQVAEALRADKRLDSVHLIAVSGYALPEDRQRALDAGFAEHIAKPADPAKVLRLLARRKRVPST